MQHFTKLPELLRAIHEYTTSESDKDILASAIDRVKEVLSECFSFVNDRNWQHSFINKPS